jgi:hypothetical protein
LRSSIAPRGALRIGAGLLDGSESPNGQHLLISRQKRPFSYLHPYRLFPTEFEVWNQAGKVTTVASLPLIDRVPLGGCRPSARYPLVGNEAATVMWVQALDSGNPLEVES